MPHEKSVRVTHVARVERVGRDHLRRVERSGALGVGRVRDRCAMAFVGNGAEWTLGQMLFGKPLSARGEGDAQELCDALNRGLQIAMEVLSWEVGPCDALEQARLEWNRVVQMPATLAGISAKRAALLFAMHRIPALEAAFALNEPALVQDLRTRVLPIAIPSFVAGMGQCPEQLMLLVTTLTQLWPNEPMGIGVGAEERAGATHVEESERILRDCRD